MGSVPTGAVEISIRSERMRIVLFSRVPAWYSFKGDRLVNRLSAEGYEIVGVVIQRVPTRTALKEWLFKLGPQVFFRKVVKKALRAVGFLPKSSESKLHNELQRTAVAPTVHVVDSHNSPACIDIVRSLQPDVIVLRGRGIIKKPILDIPRLGVLNPHYAILPTYRGMDVTEWAALHGDTVAVSVHFVAEGVDTGAVLASRPVPLQRGDTLGHLRDKSAVIAVDLFVEVLAKLKAGTLLPRHQSMMDGRQYFVMHSRLRQLANERLKRI